MKDGALKACVAMVCVVAVYSVNMLANAIAGQPVPDGYLLTGVVGAVCALGGYTVASSVAKTGKAA